MLKVLVCEDNPLIALDLYEQVRAAGHECVGIGSVSTQCLLDAARSRPDVVLVDLNLADGRTGPQLVERLADIDIPSIVISGEVRFLPEGHRAFAVIEKPLRTSELTAALSEISRQLN